MASIKDTNYPIPSGAYFVSPTGADTNPGTQASPWRTLEKAISSAQSDSTIVIREGIYREGDLSLGKQLRLQPYPSEKVWIKGSLKVEDWVADGSLWCKDNWSHKFDIIPPNDDNIDPTYPQAGHRDMVFVNGNSQRQVLNKASVEPGTFFVDYSTSKLYIGTDPTNKVVEATAFMHALSIYGPASGSVIRGLGFLHYAGDGTTVQPGATNVKFEDNTFAWNSVRGLLIYGTDAIVRGNTFSYNGRGGLMLSRSHRSLVELNVMSHNNVEHFETNWSAAGFKCGSTNSLTLRDNTVEHNRSHGIWADESCTDTTIVRNIVRHNKNSGIFFEISHSALIASNLCVQNSIGIFVLESSKARIFNNTISRCTENIRIREGQRANDKAEEVAAGITHNTYGTVLKNNLLSNTQGLNDEGLSLLVDVYNNNNPDSTSLVAEMNHNAYYRTNSGDPATIIRYRPDPAQTGPDVKYATVAAFEAAKGLERNAVALDDVATNPFFVNEAAGDYRLKASCSANGKGQALPADIASAIGVVDGVAVDMGALPAVSIASPTSSSILVAGSDVFIIASVFNCGGSIDKVEFFLNGTKLGEDTTAPYSFRWESISAGNHTLTAKATDNQGVVTTSSPMVVEVNKAPTVSITAPVEGAVVPAGTDLEIKVGASDPDGSIDKVEFFRNGTKLGEDTTAPYSFRWENALIGDYTLTAKATDDKGLVTTSSPVSIEVSRAPTVSIVAPPGGAVKTAGTSLEIRASASDPDGSVAKVEFFLNGTKLGEDTTAAPYSFLWESIPAGNHTLTAKATDNQGVVTTSSPVSIRVNKAPTVSIVAPLDGAVKTAGTSLEIKANASDPDGSITKVEFFRGTTKLGEDTTAAPYSFLWESIPVGDYTLTAKATDNQGVVTASSPVRVRVNKVPTVSIFAPADGAVKTAGTSLEIKANASDPDGSITKVEFFRGTTKLGEDTTAAPYSFLWESIPAGNHTLTAKATDNQGAIATSSSVSMIVR